MTALSGSGSLGTATVNAPPEPWVCEMVISEIGAISSCPTTNGILEANPPKSGLVKVSVYHAVALLPSTMAGRSASYSLESSGAPGTTRSTDAGTGSGRTSSLSSGSGSSDASSSAVTAEVVTSAT